MVPVSTAEHNTDRAALLPELPYKPTVAAVPVKNMSMEQVTGLLIFFRYKTDAVCVHRMLNNGRTTPVRMDTAVPK